MSEFEYIMANDFDRAWLNFELDLPLKPSELGVPNPFYVSRPENPISELTDGLLAPFFRPPKFFFSGHRGCGKSTELLHLMANQEIQKKYWPINFSIRDEADIIDLDFRDVLLAIGGRLFRSYHEQGGKLPEQLLRELNSWRGKVEQETKTVVDGRVADYEASAAINTFFSSSKMFTFLSETGFYLFNNLIINFKLPEQELLKQVCIKNIDGSVHKLIRPGAGVHINIIEQIIIIRPNPEVFV